MSSVANVTRSITTFGSFWVAVPLCRWLGELSLAHALTESA